MVSNVRKRGLLEVQSNQPTRYLCSYLCARETFMSIFEEYNTSLSAVKDFPRFGADSWQIIFCKDKDLSKKAREGFKRTIWWPYFQIDPRRIWCLTLLTRTPPCIQELDVDSGGFGLEFRKKRLNGSAGQWRDLENINIWVKWDKWMFLRERNTRISLVTKGRVRRFVLLPSPLSEFFKVTFCYAFPGIACHVGRLVG